TGRAHAAPALPGRRAGRARRRAGAAHPSTPVYDRPGHRPRAPGGAMSEYTVVRIEEIDELSDGRAPMRPVRHHLGITSFGVNTWTGKAAGDRIINEHDEADDEGEELYLVHQGRARFELDGQTFDAPAGTLVYAQSGVMRTAFAEEPGTTIVAMGG